MLNRKCGESVLKVCENEMILLLRTVFMLCPRMQPCALIRNRHLDENFTSISIHCSSNGFLCQSLGYKRRG